MSFMRRLMTQKIGSTFIPYDDIFLGYGIAITVTAPTGCDTANVRMWGAGGAGGVRGGPSQTTTGGGGGGGAFTIKKAVSVTGGSSTFTCTAGVGGLAPVVVSAGGNGANSTVSGTISLTTGGGRGGGGNTSTAGAFGVRDLNGDAESANGTSGSAGGPGTCTGGDVGGLSFITPTNANAGIGGTFVGSEFADDLTPPGGGGHGGTLSWVPGDPADSTLYAAQDGASGLIKIRWTKSNGSNTTPYVIYNIPLTFVVDSTPVYNTCAPQQVYTTTTGRKLWEYNTATITGLSFFRPFVANTTTNTCDFSPSSSPSGASSLTLRIRGNGNLQVPQSFFTSIILPNGFTFDSSSADYSYDNISDPLADPPYVATFDSIWSWNSVPDGILSAGANQNIRFKV